MKKILLIEDRYERQKLFMEATNIELSRYNNILDNFVNEAYDELELQLNNNNFNFEKYDYIISHKSAFGNRNSDVLGTLKDYCTKHQITLVLFSGGISVNYYDNSDFEILELNSKTFYSQNLPLFLDAVQKDNENILMLCYGTHWQENIVSNMIEKVNLVLLRLYEPRISKLVFDSFIDIQKLNSIDFNFYKTKTENNDISREEVEKLKDSLYKYFDNIEDTSDSTQKTLLIDNDNTEDELFDNRIVFTSNVSNIDEYISKEIIAKDMKGKDFESIYIKDNLSSNYLELYGIRLAYHIRLSSALKDTRFVPIFIISDFDGGMLNKFEPMARILFTKNIYLIENTVAAVKKAQLMQIQNLTIQEYQTEFLDKVKVEQPKDYLTHHGIANEWSMYRWAEYLDVNTPDIEKIRDEISSMLYFKYLQAKFPIKQSLFAKHKQKIQCKDKCKILVIDDEWEKGWKSIFEHLSLENQDCSLETVEEVYKDKSQEEIIKFIMKKVMSVDPDVIILDMRLHEDDFLEGKKLADFTGILIFNQIKEINPGIQVIIFTASSNSLLLDELHSYDSSILGYVKKEHPKDYNLTTQGNINKLIGLVNKGFERKFLKEIYTTKREIENILQNDIFNQYIENIEKYDKFWIKLKLEAESIADILDGNSKNRFLYAMVSIASSLETILTIFTIEERNSDNKFWDNEVYNENTLNTKIKKLFHYKFGYPELDRAGHRNKKIDMKVLITRRNDYLHTRKIVTVKKEEITSWYKKLLEMLKTIQNPPMLKKYRK